MKNSKRMAKILIFAFLFLFYCSKDSTKPPDDNGREKNYGYLSGAVKDTGTNLPLSGAIVKLTVIDVSDTTGRQGACSMDSREIGSDTIRVVMSKYVSEWKAVNIQEDTLFQDFYLQYKEGIDCIPTIDTNHV